MAIKVTPEQAQQMYTEHLQALDSEEQRQLFQKRFPSPDVYIDWLDYTSVNGATPQHKRLNLEQVYARQ